MCHSFCPLICLSGCLLPRQMQEKFPRMSLASALQIERKNPRVSTSCLVYMHLLIPPNAPSPYLSKLAFILPISEHFPQYVQVIESSPILQNTSFCLSFPPIMIDFTLNKYFKQIDEGGGGGRERKKVKCDPN